MLRINKYKYDKSRTSQIFVQLCFLNMYRVPDRSKHGRQRQQGGHTDTNTGLNHGHWY